nr:hypothetical protein [Prevotella sp.]
MGLWAGKMPRPRTSDTVDDATKRLWAGKMSRPPQYIPAHKQ